MTTAFSPTASAVIHHRFTAVHASQNSLRLVLGPLFGMGALPAVEADSAAAAAVGSAEDNDVAAASASAAIAVEGIGSPEDGAKAIKVLADWLSYYAKAGGALDAPSPAVVYSTCGTESEAGMPQTVQHRF